MVKTPVGAVAKTHRFAFTGAIYDAVEISSRRDKAILRVGYHGQHIIWQIAFRYVICHLGLKCFISRLKLQKRLKFLFQNLPNVQILFCC